MLAALLALTLTQDSASFAGDWLVVSVNRVIAPDQTPGQCFLRAVVDQVVHGRSFRPGDPIAISLACREGGRIPAADAPEPPTIGLLRAARRALVHVDAGGRVLDNGYYAVAVGEP